MRHNVPPHWNRGKVRCHILSTISPPLLPEQKIFRTTRRRVVAFPGRIPGISASPGPLLRRSCRRLSYGSRAILGSTFRRPSVLRGSHPRHQCVAGAPAPPLMPLCLNSASILGSRPRKATKDSSAGRLPPG